MIQHFDAEHSNITGRSLPAYIVGTDRFLYSGSYTIYADKTLNLRKGKTPLPAVDITGYFSVKNGVAYYLHSDTLSISTNKGDDWSSYVLPSKNYDCIYAATESIVLVGASNGVDGIAVSEDGGKTWKRVPASVTGDMKIYSFGAAGFIMKGSWIAAGTNNGVILSHDNGKSWRTLTAASDANILDSAVGRVYIYDPFIFLVQESGISRGKLGVNSTGSPGVEWDEPYVDIPHWYYKVPFERNNIGVVFFTENPQLDIGLMATPSGMFHGYDCTYTEGPITEVIGTANSFAKGNVVGKDSGGRQTVPHLKMPELMSEIMPIFFLSPHRVLSVSDDGATTWQAVDITSA